MAGYYCFVRITFKGMNTKSFEGRDSGYIILDCYFS